MYITDTHTHTHSEASQFPYMHPTQNNLKEMDEVYKTTRIQQYQCQVLQTMHSSVLMSNMSAYIYHLKSDNRHNSPVLYALRHE